MSFENKLDEFRNLITGISLFDPSEELLVMSFGVDNNIIYDYATLLTAI